MLTAVPQGASVTRRRSPGGAAAPATPFPGRGAARGTGAAAGSPSSTVPPTDTHGLLGPVTATTPTGGGIGEPFNGWGSSRRSPLGIDGRPGNTGSADSVEVAVRDDASRTTSTGPYTLPNGHHWPRVSGAVRGAPTAELRHVVHAPRHGTGLVASAGGAMSAVAVRGGVPRPVASGNREHLETPSP